MYGQRRLGSVQDEELAPAQPQQRHLWGRQQKSSVEGLTQVKNLQVNKNHTVGEGRRCHVNC